MKNRQRKYQILQYMKYRNVDAEIQRNVIREIEYISKMEQDGVLNS